MTPLQCRVVLGRLRLGLRGGCRARRVLMGQRGGVLCGRCVTCRGQFGETA
jgi:hypothetical protein